MRKPRQTGDLEKWPLRAAPPCCCGKPKAPASKRTYWHARHMQTASPQRRRSLYLPARRLPARVPPRGAAGIVCHEAAAGSIHWAESPAALNHPAAAGVLTSAFFAIGCMTVERVGATNCAQRAMSNASSGSMRTQSAKFQATTTKAASRAAPSTDGRRHASRATTARAPRRCEHKKRPKGPISILTLLEGLSCCIWAQKKWAARPLRLRTFSAGQTPRKYFSIFRG